MIESVLLWGVMSALHASNTAPEGVVFLEPLDGGEVEVVQPLLIATEGADPEGDSVIHFFEIDESLGFDSASLLHAEIQGVGDGSVVWDLSLDPTAVLAEHATLHARVRSMDPEGLASPWNTITFFVRGPNDPPSVPVLVSPRAGDRITVAAPEFEIEPSADPELDAVSHEIRVSTDSAMANVVSEGLNLGVEASSEFVSWQSDEDLEGEVFWAARAVDQYGEASDWTTPRKITVGVGQYNGGVTCAVTPADIWWEWSVGGVALLLMRRRRGVESLRGRSES